MGLSWGAPERSWASLGCLLEGLGAYLERFGMILGTQGGVQIENNEKLEFDDPLNENAMFLRSQGF